MGRARQAAGAVLIEANMLQGELRYGFLILGYIHGYAQGSSSGCAYTDRYPTLCHQWLHCASASMSTPAHTH